MRTPSSPWPGRLVYCYEQQLISKTVIIPAVTSYGGKYRASERGLLALAKTGLATGRYSDRRRWAVEGRQQQRNNSGVLAQFEYFENGKIYGREKASDMKCLLRSLYYFCSNIFRYREYSASFTIEMRAQTRVVFT
jgi:hypothetical protein